MIILSQRNTKKCLFRWYEFSNFWTINFGTFFGFSFHTFNWLAETPQKECVILQQFTHSLIPESTLKGQLRKIKAIPPTVNYVKCFLYNQKTDVYTLSLSQIRFKVFSRLRRFLVDLPLIVYEKKSYESPRRSDSAILQPWQHRVSSTSNFSLTSSSIHS